jgi:hypothetical protein
VPVAPPQVVEDLDWGADPYQGCVLVPLAVPERVSQVTALLRCRVKLVSPGVNGDPEYQNFEETKRWVGKQCLLAYAVHASGTRCTLQAHTHWPPAGQCIHGPLTGMAVHCKCNAMVVYMKVICCHAFPWLDLFTRCALTTTCIGYHLQ